MKQKPPVENVLRGCRCRGDFSKHPRNLDVFAFRSIQVLQELLAKLPEKFSRFSWQVRFSCYFNASWVVGIVRMGFFCESRWRI